MNEVTRTDDKFLRWSFWTVLTLLLGSVGGWIWTISALQAEVDNTKREMENTRKEMRILKKTQLTISNSMHSIDKGVAILVSSAVIRNELLEEKNKKQAMVNKVAVLTRKEQKRRRPLTNWVEMKMAEEKRYEK